MTRPIPLRRNDTDVKEERVSYIGFYKSIPFTIGYSNQISFMVTQRNNPKSNDSKFSEPLCEHDFGSIINKNSGDYTIVMENAPIHHSNQEFYDAYVQRVKYKPPYSPFMNPREEVRNGDISANYNLTKTMIAACSEITTANVPYLFPLFGKLLPEIFENGIYRKGVT
ncbi:hypothetical protein RF11_06071 [Thelohanellus kitauei]|uniref:Tc1-like transposase DDE domain-containing protein n=1 Tax=Thelohanellus kitauei TaxID=669202 RepID=A0A0C2N2U0_THEKT|nr:hypothetical protein RF11_06071 [Thelohanellus kitauei]